MGPGIERTEQNVAAEAEEVSGYRLSDLLDVTNIQRMSDAHYRASGMPVGIIDAIDGSILVACGWQDICSKFHRANPLARRRCEESDAYISRHVVPGEVCRFKCQNGLWDFALPIMVGGRLLATMFLGQFFYEGELPDREFFIQRAHEFGFDVDSYLEALDRVPIFSREKVEFILQYDEALVRFIADLAENALSRIRAEKLTSESERKFRALFDQSCEFIGLVSTGGTLLEANQTALKFRGVAEAAVIGRPFWQTAFWNHSAELQEQVRLAVQQAAKGVLVRFEATHHDVDGCLHTFDFSLKPAKDEAGTVVFLLAESRENTEYKQAEAALRESELRYRKLFSSNPQPMWVYDVETLVFQEVNDAAVAHYGYSREEFLNMTIRDIRPPEEIKPLQARLAEARNGYKFVGRTRHRKKDGTIISVEVALHRFMQDGRLVSLVLANDVTVQKRAEEAVYRSEAMLRSFVDGSPFGIFRTHVEEDRFLSVNPALVKMLGYDSAEELLSKRLSADVYRVPQERAKTLTPLRRDGVNGVEVQCKRKNGEVATLYLSGRLIEEPSVGPCFEGIVEDITERKCAEQALSDSEKRFRQVVEGAPVGMYIQTQGVFRYFNPAALAMFGAERPDQIIGQGFLERIHPDSRAAVIERARAVETEQTFAPFLEERLLRLDGTVFDGEVTAMPFVFEGRNGALVFVRDITRRKQEEEKRCVLEQQLRQAQKMEAVGRLAGGIAHDFNNLLMVIQSYTEMLQTRLPEADPLRRHTREIMKASDRAASLTRQMLAFSRKQIISPVVLDLNMLVYDTASMLKRIIGEDIEFRIEPAEPLWPILADSDQMVQVLMNLCVNSRDAMPQGGTLTIATGNVSLEPGSVGERSYLSPGDYVKLTVTDTGMGIGKEMQEQIFEPFYTTKELGKGTGLGLAMVYGVAKHSGGYVWVDSEVGQGACFTMYLPRAKEKVVPGKPVQTATLPGGKETLLVVEDEEALREAMCENLRSLGYTVLAAGSGQQALAREKTHNGHIDLLITDIVMPKISGRELAQAMESVRPDMKTIYISGYTDDAVLRHGVQDLGTAFMQKPFGLDMLAVKVRTLLGQGSDASKSL